MATKDQSWFERKVRELGDALRRLPRSRRRALVTAIEADRDPEACQGTGGQPDKPVGESTPRWTGDP
jgi:hypothetical protein